MKIEQSILSTISKIAIYLIGIYCVNRNPEQLIMIGILGCIGIFSIDIIENHSENGNEFRNFLKRNHIDFEIHTKIIQKTKDNDEIISIIFEELPELENKTDVGIQTGMLLTFDLLNSRWTKENNESVCDMKDGVYFGIIKVKDNKHLITNMWHSEAERVYVGNSSYYFQLVQLLKKNETIELIKDTNNNTVKNIEYQIIAIDRNSLITDENYITKWKN